MVEKVIGMWVAIREHEQNLWMQIVDRTISLVDVSSWTWGALSLIIGLNVANADSDESSGFECLAFYPPQ